MDKIKDTRTFMRITHRYLGFFLAGIMAVYAVSGVLLVYRDTDFLKKEKKYEKTIGKNLSEKNLGKELKIKNFEVQKTEGSVLKFKQGIYNAATGEAKYTKKELPFILDKMTKLHKSQSKDTLSPLNTFFGFALFFFVISSFWMFNPKTKAFKRGMMFTGAGLVVAIILLLI
ncbi:PepSY domain-containing protein [Chryseobacterium sp. SSA4.19]|uniref:PepSY domain-containing protein n=1 Tax=Chryseobacterium sp. SSA4.19 TaxID=2919915 RepID=UPI001F4E1FDD|nr:PepSY domain-containing protein [Chryseobacterium sp. SSA4.19]MCJ8152166.1 PepSY domain-containing protein [Chryseobacterium sp. SSA4.19]